MTRRIDNPDTDADVELRRYLDAGGRRNFVMIAGAGSGKTTSLVKALDHIGKKHGDALRRDKKRVACITYTEVAVGEIWGDVGHDPLFHVSTIHSFLWSIVKPFQKDIGGWVRNRIGEKLEDLRTAREAFGKRTQQRTLEKNERETAKLEHALCSLASISSFRYENGSDYSNGILGHDDIVKMVPKLILERPLLASIVAQKYPFFFVDESQDTLPTVVDCLRSVAEQYPDSFCLGFFGDAMQKIYPTGIGTIELAEGWKEITKPENFRCPKAVLEVINNIRADGDGLKQERGRHELVEGKPEPVLGSAALFVLPVDDSKIANLQRVREWLAEKHSDPLWHSNDPEANVRIMVIVHRMAAVRLGFPDLFAAFTDGTSESMKTSFADGTTWAVKPFLGILLPLCSAFIHDRHFEVMQLLRRNSPLLGPDHVRSVESPEKLLAELKTHVHKLTYLMSDSADASVGEVLRYVHKHQLIRLDERVSDYLSIESDSAIARERSESTSDEESERIDKAIGKFLDCPVKQLWGYQQYITDESPYSTHHGVKGAEFDRVLVILDDDEGRYNLYSYEKLLGLKNLSDNDKDKIRESEESVLDRSRRLLYVCCSRATKDLVVVLFTAEPESAAKHLRKKGFFDAKDIYTLASMN